MQKTYKSDIFYMMSGTYYYFVSTDRYHWPNLSALFWLMSSLGNLKFISRNMYQMRGPTHYPQKNRQLFPKNFPQRSWSSLLKDDQQVSIYSFIHHDNFSQHFTYSNDSIYYEKAIYVYYRV